VPVSNKHKLLDDWKILTVNEWEELIPDKSEKTAKNRRQASRARTMRAQYREYELNKRLVKIYVKTQRTRCKRWGR